MKVYEVLSAAMRVNDVYAQFENRSSNIEYNCTRQGNQTIYSVKGTDVNQGRYGWFSLLSDIWSDVRFLPRRNREMKVYQPAGFMTAGVELANTICVDHDKDERIQLEGHSLGGAVVLIAADVLIRRGYEVSRVIALGAPRPGKLKFIALTDCVCVKAGGDIITTLPPMYWSAPLSKIGIKRDYFGDHALVASYIEILQGLDQEGEL